MSTTTTETKPPLPPFTRETAIQKIRMAGKTMLYSAFVGAYTLLFLQFTHAQFVL